MEYEVIKHGIDTVRATLVDLAANAVLDEASRTITYKQHKVALFYFRDGYEPDHYPTDQCWELREKIERSTAVSVPTVSMQLVNFKRVQQQLSEEFLQSYLSKEESRLLTDCMAKMWNFEDESTREKLITMTESGRIVLKPNREGGGHNTYGKDVAVKLRSLPSDTLTEYVLMERIYPQPTCNLLIKNQKLYREPCVISEISIYSTVLYTNKEHKSNRIGGWLVRTKPISCDEGGVATGFSVLNSLRVC